MFTDWQNFLDTVNRAGFAWNDLLGQVGGQIFKPWTPIDASGAGLTLTGVSASYRRIGNEVNAMASFTYPATVSGANAIIGGFPFPTANMAGACSGILCYHFGATATKFLMNQNASTGNFVTNAGINVTNAQMTGTLSYIQAIYRV